MVVLAASFFCLDLRVLVKPEVLDAAGLGNTVWVRLPVFRSRWRVRKSGVESEWIALWDGVSASASELASGVAVASLGAGSPQPDGEATATLPDMWRRSKMRSLTFAKSWHAASYCEADDGAETERGLLLLWCCGRYAEKLDDALCEAEVKASRAPGPLGNALSGEREWPVPFTAVEDSRRDSDEETNRR